MEYQESNPVTSFNWVNFCFLLASPFIAIAGVSLYVAYFDFHWFDLTLLLLFYFLSGLGITAGYHRYYSHRTHKAHPALQLFYLFFGGIALQQSVLLWARNHRIHHRFTDSEKDPHNIKKGFFYAHMGWIFYNREQDNDFSVVKDLLQDRFVHWQRVLYWPIMILGGFCLPAFLGWLFFDRPLAGFLWGGLLRVVLQSHVIYSINSVAHTFGSQQFSLRYEARDSWLLALLSNGEGFHSYHHRFAFDYRNGWKWYHWDPSKWFIGVASYVGLASDLKRASEASIVKAKIATDYQRLKDRIYAMPEDMRTAFEAKLTEAKQNLEALATKIIQTKMEYKELRRDRKITCVKEKSMWQQMLQEQRKEFRLAQDRWRALMTADSRLNPDQLLGLLQTI